MEYLVVINLKYEYIKGGKRRKKETRGGIRNTGDGLRLPAGWPSVRSEKMEMKARGEGGKEPQQYPGTAQGDERSRRPDAVTGPASKEQQGGWTSFQKEKESKMWYQRGSQVPGHVRPDSS